MKISVLLVDDEKDYINSLFKQLVVRNYNVTAVYDGDEAIKTIRQRAFDVILLDVLMPGKDGIKTLKEIKKIDPTVQVIMHTGHAKIDLAIDGLKSGICDYIIKPIDIDELTKKIELAYSCTIINKPKV
jgi:DNA-binding NtrC family response regulator